MVPLWIFLLVWVVLMAAYAPMSLISLMQMIRYGIASPVTYMSTLVFLVVVVGVMAGTSIFLATVDWQQGVNIFGSIGQFFLFNPTP